MRGRGRSRPMLVVLRLDNERYHDASIWRGQKSAGLALGILSEIDVHFPRRK